MMICTNNLGLSFISTFIAYIATHTSNIKNTACQKMYNNGDILKKSRLIIVIEEIG
jgi:hypothetical protein